MTLDELINNLKGLRLIVPGDTNVLLFTEIEGTGDIGDIELMNEEDASELPVWIRLSMDQS